MKNLFKIALLALVISVYFTACGDGEKAAKVNETGQVDSTKKDATAVKPDTVKTDTIKK